MGQNEKKLQEIFEKLSQDISYKKLGVILV